jgi:hypothetical protein
MWFFVYDMSASTGIGSTTLGGLVTPTSANLVPIAGATFGWVGANEVISLTGTNGWYWHEIPQNTNFSYAASGYDTEYSNTNRYTQMLIGMQSAGGK